MWRTLWACLTMSSIIFYIIPTFASLFGDKPSLRWADLCNKHIYHASGF